MQEQVSSILETINDGLRELPNVGSEMWDLYVRGVRVDGLVSLISHLVFMIIAIIFFTKLLQWYKKCMNDDQVDSEQKFEFKVFTCLGCVVFIMTLGFSLNSMIDPLRQIIAPEYYIIQQIIESL